MVKKNFVVPMLLGSLLAALLATGCASMTKVWDETLPESEMAFLSFTLAGKVIGYNGVALEKAYYFIKIPAGNADLIINMAVNTTVGGWGGTKNVHYEAEGMEFTFSFEAGREYTFQSLPRDENGDPWGKGDGWVWGVEIYDYFPKVGYPPRITL